MTSLFISPFPPPKWLGEIPQTIDISTYITKIKEKWPKIHLVQHSQSNLLLEWEIQKSREYELSCKIFSAQQNGKITYVQFHGDINVISSFVKWHYDHVFNVEELYFFDEGLNFIIKIDHETDPHEIISKIKK